MNNDKILDGMLALDVIRDNNVLYEAIEAGRIVGVTQYSGYTTLVTLDDLDNGDTIIVAAPYKVAKEMIDKALAAREGE